MIRWRRGTVENLGKAWQGALEISVRVDAAASADSEHLEDPHGTDERGSTIRALAYPDLVGMPEPGDTVLLNTTALSMGLGTGGYALVVANASRLPADTAGPGHLVKARYTPSQATVLGVDEQDSPHHKAIRDANGIDGMPVVVADLHSALPAILAGILADRPSARVAYVMTDGGALPIWFSRTVSALADLLCGTVTVGQALGGDLEAVTLHTGLIAARHVLNADVTIVSQGPGNLGTGTPWGFSGVAAGEAINAIAVLGGTPIASPRVSDADARERHTGVSHHSLTAYGKVALTNAYIPIPAELPIPLDEAVKEDLAPLATKHTIVDVDCTGLDEALRKIPVKLSTMGRSLDEDYSYFLTAAAAGRWAANKL